MKCKTATVIALFAVLIIIQAGMPALGKGLTLPGRLTAPIAPTAPTAPTAPPPVRNGVTDPPEYRASWVYSWGSEFASSAATTTLINTLADNNFNIVIPEIRKAGDAYYNSAYEPWATDVQAGYDPLADLCAKAHARGLEVHGWIVAYRVWPRNRIPPSTHVWARHPEWAMVNSSGSIVDGSYYNLDPGVPGVQQYICDLMKDCIAKYDIDGYNFDYIRYPAYNWGYNPISRERFRRQYGYFPPTVMVTNPSSPGYEAWQNWCEWRRQQVTDFVKKCYLEAIHLKPRIKMSCDTIGWMGGNPNVDFTGTRAYTEVCQDHEGWMQEHIIDMNILMDYKRDWTGLLAPTYRYKGYSFGNQQADHRLWSDWLTSIQAETGRHSLDGIGGYMNIMQGILDQWGYSRSRYTFDPETRTYNIVGSDLLTENYAATQQAGTTGGQSPAPLKTPTQDAAVTTSGWLQSATTVQNGRHVLASIAPAAGALTASTTGLTTSTGSDRQMAPGDTLYEGSVLGNTFTVLNAPAVGSSNTVTFGGVGSGLPGDTRSTGLPASVEITQAGSLHYPVGIEPDVAAAQRAGKADMIARNPQAARKLSGELFELVDRESRLGRASALEFGRARGLEISDDKVIVIAVPVGGVPSSQLADAIVKAGGEIILIGDGFVKANIPLGLLGQMATGVADFGYARLPAKPRLDNLTISQGINDDTVTNAKNWHDHGFTGNGVKVAIIDLGFIGLAALKAADEIPASAIEVDYTGTGMEATTEHGCGVAETVYDMAPNAQLYLIKIGDETHLQQAEIDCKTNGIKVINHSVGWDGFNFFDGVAYSSMSPSPVSTVDDANANGILWMNSAGNARQRHARIQWRDGNNDGFLDWGQSGVNVNQIGNLSAGTPVVISLTWNTWPTTAQDFDLYLVYWTGSAWEIVAGSAGWQTGTQPPTEAFGYVVPSSRTGYYGLAVLKYSATMSPTFIVRSWYEPLEYYGYDNPYTNNNPASGSIGCPADAASAFAVGAINWNNYRTGPSESFSSIGPNNRAYTGGASLIKPDICGPDGNSSVTYDNYPPGFLGTSSSSPHLAGAAALVWSRFPAYTNAQVRSYLETGSSNRDLGNIGKDNEYGYGALVLTKLWSISGYARDSAGAAVSEVLVSANNGGGSYTTAGDGYYTVAVPNGWSGTVSPSKAGYAFTPASRGYVSVVADWSDQDYTAIRQAYVISGYVRTADGAPVSFVQMNGLPGSPTPKTDAAGYYSALVPFDWSGTVTPARWHNAGLCMYRYGFSVGLEDPAAPGLPVFAYNNVVAQGSETLFYSTIKSTMFQNPAPIPDMPWKSNPTEGYLFGQITDALEPNDTIYQNWIYQATVIAEGPAGPDSEEWDAETDATGTYGFMDLPPGDYTVTVMRDGYAVREHIPAAVVAGRATRLDVQLGPLIPPENEKPISDLLDSSKTPDGMIVALKGQAAVTSASGVFTGYVYVEAVDRSSGMQVRLGSTQQAVSEGDRVELMGMMSTIAGERVLTHGAIMSRSTGASLAALGSTARDMSRSPNATGLLMRICGKVTDLGIGWFQLSDGSGTARVLCPGMLVPAKGLAVNVTGLNCFELSQRVLRIRRQSDIGVVAKSTVSAPTGTITTGLNLFSLPYVPTDPTASAALVGIPIHTRLFRWDNATQAFISYDQTQPVVFGSTCPSEGYALFSTAARTFSFEGLPNPTVDARIALPVKGWTLIGYPFLTATLWDHCLVTDGSRTLSLNDAVAAGWIGRIAFTWDSASGNFGYVGTGARGSRFDDSLRPWKAYWLATYQNGLALIIPAGG